jgi:hypothetical protein
VSCASEGDVILSALEERSRKGWRGKLLLRVYRKADVYRYCRICLVARYSPAQSFPFDTLTHTSLTHSANSPPRLFSSTFPPPPPLSRNTHLSYQRVH